MVVPLKTECASLFHHYPALPVYQWDWPKKQMNCGSVAATGLKLPFVYAIWLGNDHRGIQFFSESDESWSPADHENAVTVTTDGKAAILRMNMLSNIEISREWRWSFGFVATPVKPYLNKHYSIHYCQLGGYGEEKPAADGGPSQLDVVLKRSGVTHVGCHEMWSDEQSLPRPKRAEDLHSLIKGCHDLGMGLVLYTGSWMSVRSPEFNRDWRSRPIDEHFVYERADNHDKCYYMCPNSGFPDLQLKLYEEAFRQYGMDGLYMDGTAASLPCRNMKHGCGYVGKDRKAHETMPIWKPRETMKRFRQMVHSQPRPCIIVGHTSASITLPILSFVDIYLDGEHLLGQRKLGTDEYPEDILRAEMSGHNFGIPAIQLPISGTPNERERARTVALLHDALMEWGLESADIWRAFDSFGMEKIEWKSAQETANLATCDDAQVRISAYLDKGRGALLAVANLGPREAVAKVTVNRRALGLRRGPLRARDEVSSEDLPVQDDSVSVRVGDGKFRLISIQTAQSLKTPPQSGV